MNNMEKDLAIAEQRRILDKFLVDNPELEELSAKLSVFNILDVLKIEKAEIRHSNVLAWLLDPQGSHGIGQSFIRRLLSTILMENETADIEIKPAEIELMNMVDAEVLREWKNIDLLAISENNKFVLLIENKIKSKATKQQLEKYLKIIKEAYPSFTIIPVLATLVEDDEREVAEKSGFISYSHAQIYDVAENIIKQKNDRIPKDARIFIEHYLTTLRRLTMKDDQLVGLCKAIYKKHKEAINLIYELGATTQFLDAADDFIAKNKQLEKLYSGGRGFYFIDKGWKEKMPACSNGWENLSKPYPIACWFEYRAPRSKLGFIIEVGSMEDSEKRIALITTFKEKGFKMRAKALTPESKSGGSGKLDRKGSFLSEALPG